MNARERIGSWLGPVLRGAGFAPPDTVEAEKGSTVVEPADAQITTSDELYDLVWGAGVFQDVHPILAYRLYLKSDVLGSVVHRIAHSIAGFTLGLTSDDQDFDDGSPVVEFLNAGSEGYSKRRFFYELATSYLLTNEAWVVLRGRQNAAPVARTWVYPFDVINHQDVRDGLPVAFRTVGDRDRRTYQRVEQRGSIRWLSDDGLNELVPVLGAEAIDRPFRGQSPVAPLLYSVKQNVEGKRHNTAILANGLRLTGAVQPAEGETLTDAAKSQVVKAFQALRGASTAGGTLVLPKRLETLDLAINNREMDYIQMLVEAKETVYGYYAVPLPLISNEASTFDNFTTAQTAYYDGAVFPVFEDIASGMAECLKWRFPELTDRRISYNENTIKALKGRNLERMRKGREANALTTNEIREMGGYEADETGGEILVPSTLVAIGEEPEPPVTPLPTPQEAIGETEPLTDETEGEAGGNDE